MSSFGAISAIQAKITIIVLHLNRPILKLSTVFILLITPLLLAHYCPAQNNNDTISSSDTLMPVEQVPLNSKAIDAIVNYKAKDSMVFNLMEKKIYLYNKGEIKYESIELSSNILNIDLTNNIVHAEGTTDSLGNISGEPVFKDDSETFSAHMLDYNIKTKKGKINKIITKQGEGYIHGNEVKKLENGIMYIKNGKYTTCSHKDPHFYIGSSRLKVVKDNKIVTGPAILFVGDVPTPLGIPFGFFPITKGRSSGIIIPAYGNSISRGYFLREGGYYFGLSDFFDLRLTGNIFTLGSWGAKAVSGYKKRYRYNGKFSLKTSTIKISEEGLSDYKVIKDFSINWRHNQDPKANPYRRFSAFVDFGTSTYDKFNAFAINNKLKNTYKSNINYLFSNPAKKHTLALSVGHSQNNINQTMNFTLPQITLNRKRF
ncbi:MAG: LPS-assembly protein LptD, partial [Bacteroidetes bacterium]|nr:LPS-assembly protein LptD [Bacteroidota bacterium]